MADSGPGPASAVSFDAFGTLLELEPPGPALCRALARAGHPKSRRDVERAISAEIAYYRENMQDGRDEASLAVLRRECAGVLADAIPGATPPLPELTELLVGCLVFRAHPDAIPALEALRMAEVPVLVLSNWDCSLPETLERLGLAHLVDHVLTSAQIGRQKPDSAAFERAAATLGFPAEEMLHVGDDPHRDAHGAHAAGLQAVLLDREGVGVSGPWRRIASLSEVPALLASG